MHINTFKWQLPLALLLNLFVLVRGYSCSCQSSGSILANVRVASIVFSGTLFSVEETGDNKSWSVYKIKVDRLFKGKIKSKIVSLWTPTEGTACGVKFRSKKVLVYATDAAFYRPNPYVEGISFYTNVCTRSGSYSLSEEKGILQALKKRQAEQG